MVENVAVTEETAGVIGAYFNRMQQTKANAQAYDQTARKNWWEISEELMKGFV